MIVRSLMAVLALLLTGAAGKPAHASELRVVRVLDGNAEIALPAELTPMSKEDRARKFPEYRPQTEIYADETGAMNLVIASYVSPPDGTFVDYVRLDAEGIESQHSVTWHGKGRCQTEDREFGYLEFTAKAPDGGPDVYTYTVFTRFRIGSEIAVFTFTVPVEQLPAWREKIRAIAATAKVPRTYPSRVPLTPCGPTR